ncbi:MAG: SDR family oxidoreductase, partial [Ilumatobacter sp.]|nr:SDR family oxidoreductase [Ilumatobacter sp.]
VEPAEVRRLYAIGTSMQCFVDPEEIADLIVYMCSDHGRHISGQVIGVDGNTETLWPRA